MSYALRTADVTGPYAYPEPSLEQEVASCGEDWEFDFMNLSTAVTGIEGVVFVSTHVGQHGPRVKYYVKRAHDEESFSVSISAEPRVVASSLPERIVRQRAPQVIEFVRLNREKLLSFWSGGNFWDAEEVEALRKALMPVV